MNGASRERSVRPIPGWLMVFALSLFSVLAVYLLVDQIQTTGNMSPSVFGVSTSILVAVAVCLRGFFVVNPNMSRVLVLFGRYKGTARKEGFFWTNPFTSRHTISLKARNVASDKIKVNDFVGSPIEIGAVVVWQVRDTAQAAFDVDNYFSYVDVQIETAVRDLAKSHPYDDDASIEAMSLRGDTGEVNQELQEELQKRLNRAGIRVIEARLSHLAYAPEIASAMLQRQQASALVAAREKIVEGAVTMVQMALHELSAQEIVELDHERRATLVGNLLVVLCGQAPATPVLNTGTLYT